MRGFSLARMDTRNEIRDFLTSRRAKLKAADVGLPDYGTRRVPGLRREEVAVLAGVSLPYYTRLERGDLAGASDSVLEALARHRTRMPGMHGSQGPFVVFAPLRSNGETSGDRDGCGRPSGGGRAARGCP